MYSIVSKLTGAQPGFLHAPVHFMPFQIDLPILDKVCPCLAKVIRVSEILISYDVSRECVLPILCEHPDAAVFCVVVDG